MKINSKFRDSPAEQPETVIPELESSTGLSDPGTS